MRVMKPVLILIFLYYTFSSFSFLSAEQNRPNILWLVVEDQSKHYGFNGEKLVHTPVLDGLAANGIRFTNASVTAPVCSTARSALITGMFQTSIGAHHHRSGRGEVKIQKPDYNFEWNPSVFDSAEWSGRKKEQPFFAKICLSGGKARSQARVWCGCPESSKYNQRQLYL